MKSFSHDESGANLAEYAFILALVVLLSIVVVAAIGTQVSELFFQATDW